MFRKIFIFALFATCCGYVFADGMPREFGADPIDCEYNPGGPGCEYMAPMPEIAYAPAPEYAPMPEEYNQMAFAPAPRYDGRMIVTETDYASAQAGVIRPDYNTALAGFCDDVNTPCYGAFPSDTMNYDSEGVNYGDGGPIWLMPGSDIDAQLRANASNNNNNDNVNVVSKIGDDLYVENTIDMRGGMHGFGRADYSRDFSGGANLTHGYQAPPGFNVYETRAEMPLMHVEMMEDDGGAVLAMSRPAQKKPSPNAQRRTSQVSGGAEGTAIDNSINFTQNIQVSQDIQNTAAASGRRMGPTFASEPGMPRVTAFAPAPMPESAYGFISESELGYAPDSEFGYMQGPEFAAAEEVKVKVSESMGTVPSKQVKDQVRSWVVTSGQTLREVLQEWSDKEGWDMVWATSREYPVQASAVFKGRYMDVASALVRNFSRATPAPYAKFYKGNRVVVISTASGE